MYFFSPWNSNIKIGKNSNLALTCKNTFSSIYFHQILHYADCFQGDWFRTSCSCGCLSNSFSLLKNTCYYLFKKIFSFYQTPKWIPCHREIICRNSVSLLATQIFQTTPIYFNLLTRFTRVSFKHVIKGMLVLE